MNVQSRSDEYESDTVVAFPPGAKDATPNDVDQLDKAGQTILKMLHKAAALAEANSQHALDMAQKLSHQAACG
jgi:hypothetical protein